MILYFHHVFESHSPIFVSIIIFAGFDLFVLRGNQVYLYASWDGTSNSVTVAVGSLERVSLGISTGTDSGAHVYVLQTILNDPSSWFISSYPKTSLSVGDPLGNGNTLLSGTTSNPFTLINGLVVCDTACQNTDCSKYTLHE